MNKTVKKILCIALMLSLMLSLCSCFSSMYGSDIFSDYSDYGDYSDYEGESSSQYIPEDEEEEGSPDGSFNYDFGTGVVPQQPSSPTTPSTPDIYTTPSVPSANDPIEGVVSGDVYTNEYFSFKAELDGWSIDAPDASQDIVLRAVHPDGATNINMVVCDYEPGISKSVLETNEKSCLEETAKGIPEYYTDLGVAVKSCEVKLGTFANTVKYAILIQCEVGGVDMTISQFVFAGEEKYAIITVTAFSQTEVNLICSSFHKI